MPKCFSCVTTQSAPSKVASRHLFSSRPPLLFGGCCKTSELLGGAVKEAVNECEASNSPPDIGGVAAPSRKRCEATAAAQTGWLGVPKCFGMPSSEEVVPFSTTPSAPFKEASRLLLDVASTPPMSGGEWRTRFIHTCIHPPTRAPSRVLQQPLQRRGSCAIKKKTTFISGAEGVVSKRSRSIIFSSAKDPNTPGNSVWAIRSTRDNSALWSCWASPAPR